MASEWQELSIGDVAEVVGGGTPSTKEEANFNGDIPWITPKDLAGYTYRYILRGERNISEQGLRNSSARLLPQGSVLLTTRAPVGYVAIAGVPVTTNQGFRSLVPRDGFSSEFIYYLLKANTEYLKNYASGTTFGELAGTTLKGLRFLFPPLPKQRAIAHILGTLDDKIELNRQMNQTLEAMAQTLFKSWFMDFEPFRDQGMQDSPLGEIPVGWKVEPLDKIAHFLNGLALQKYPPEGDEFLPVIKIVELRRGVSESSGKASSLIDKAYIVQDGDILFSWSGSLEVCIWCGGKGALNQHLFKVTSTAYPKWFYYHWIKYHLPEFQAIAAGKATTMGHIQRYHLSSALVVIPPKNVLETMDKMISPLLDRMINNNLESHTLASIRDTLLPKLLSGEIRVKDAEKFIKEGIT